MYQTYGIDTRGLASQELDLLFTATLATQLPPDARVWKKVNINSTYSITEILLNRIDGAFQSLLIGLSGDKGKGKSISQLLPLEKPKKQEEETAVLTYDQAELLVEAMMKGV